MLNKKKRRIATCKAVLNSVTPHAMTLEFGGKSGTECRNGNGVS